MIEDKFNEECAVIGVLGDPEAAKYCYLGLYAMQHRGQEGAGVVSTDGDTIFTHRGMGLVADVFDEKVLAELKGDLAIGHTRYATAGGKDAQNLQPFVANFAANSFAVAHNGNLINAAELRGELETSGSIFSTTSDTEVFLHLIARPSNKNSLVEKILATMDKVQGAYSLAFMTYDKMIAVRDPAGVRPLSLGKIGTGYVIASETCAFDLIGAEFIRDIEPGEVLEINKDGTMNSLKYQGAAKRAFCVFEYVYFSRPDSVVEGKNVYHARRQLGIELAKECPAEADLVIPVPDSGVPAALGFAQQSGIPMEFGLIRNHYVGRTFIEPQQSIRDFGVKIKLNPNRYMLEGKRIAVIDDSVVRGTTCKKIVKMLRQAGAAEVHFRISSPPTVGPCHYGIDTPSKEELVASNKTLDEIRDFIGADTLGYLSLAGMYRAVDGKQENYCDACFTNRYRLGEPKLSIGDIYSHRQFAGAN